MTDLRTAAQQALEALALWATGRDMDAVTLNDLIFRLEAALAEPVQDVKGCDVCEHPLYAGVKCRVCGRVTPGGSDA